MSRLNSFLVSCLIASTLAITNLGSQADANQGFLVSPPAVHLQGNFARAQLVVTHRDSSGKLHAASEDLTHKATYQSSDDKVVSIKPSGRLLAVGNGQATIEVKFGKVSQSITVKVDQVTDQPVIDYMHQIRPLISKAGCNMGGCHATQHGKGGFKLSVFGFEPSQDWTAIVRDRTQRRVDLLKPERSLLLAKPTLAVGHGGGQRLLPDSVDYQMLVAWLEGGAPKPNEKAPEVEKVSVTPWRRMAETGIKQQLRVEATYADGSTRDVTAWAKFDTMDDSLLTVSDEGLVEVIGKGQSGVMVRFEGQAEVVPFMIPYADSADLAGWKNNNFVDELASAKFRELGIVPSPLCDDATFLRRAMLDCTGTLPTLEETTAFIESKEPNKREQLIDRLLGLTGDPNLDIYNDRYSAYWTLKWSDLIRNTSVKLGEQGMWALHNWIRESFRTNKPYDQFVRELVTARGSIYMNGPANYFRINQNSTVLTESTSQLFLGVRLECAKCHHHPFEKYSQADYYGMAAFFSRVGTKNSQEFGLFGRETVVVVRSTGGVNHPKTRKVMEPTPLGDEPIDHPLDRRIALADWMTKPDNALFAKSVVNRYVRYLLGRGLVEPVDDMRSTNPPTNAALMDALAKDFVESQFNLKQLVRNIMVSRLYQLDSQPTESNFSDDRFYSHFYVKRLPAEPLLDAVDQATGTETKFKNLPLGTRATDLPDAEYPNYFLTTFAKPKRASVCECERTPDENLTQALHTLNGDILSGKIADGKGRVAKLLAAKKPHPEIVDELYLCSLNRYPTDEERAACETFLKESPSPKECYEDLLWALVNSKQFLYVR